MNDFFYFNQYGQQEAKWDFGGWLPKLYKVIFEKKPYYRAEDTAQIYS